MLENSIKIAAAIMYICVIWGFLILLGYINETKVVFQYTSFATIGWYIFFSILKFDEQIYEE